MAEEEKNAKPEEKKAKPDEVVVKSKDLQVLIDKITALEAGSDVLKQDILTRNKTATLAIIGDKPAYVVKVSQAQLMVHNETREQRYFVDITDHEGNTHNAVDLALFLADCARESVEIIRGSGETKEFFVKQSMVEQREVRPGDWSPTATGKKVPSGYRFVETTVEVKTKLAGVIRVPVECLNIVGAVKREEVSEVPSEIKTY